MLKRRCDQALKFGDEVLPAVTNHIKPAEISAQRCVGEPRFGFVRVEERLEGGSHFRRLPVSVREPQRGVGMTRARSPLPYLRVATVVIE